MDSAFETINTNGKFQKIVSVMVIMVGSITPFISICLPFLSKIPEMNCRYKEADYLPFVPCHEHDYCKDNIYEYQINYSDSLHNLALDYHLYCDRSYYSSIIATAFFLGGTIGSVILSPIPDSYGREGIYKILAVLSVICQLNALFTIGPIHFTITAFSAGVIAYSYSMSMLLITEYLDRKTAGLIMSLNNAFFPIQGILISLFFLFVNQWRIIFFFTSIAACVIMYLVFKYFVESPRWLNSKNRILECIQKLGEIANINGTSQQLKEFLEQNKFLINHSVSNLKEKTKALNFIDIIQCKSVRTKIICLIIIWFSSGACFYGLILNIEHLGGNMFVDSILTFSAEMTAELLSGWFADIYGRKVVLEVGNIMGGISFIIYEMIEKSPLKTALIFSTSFGFSSVFNVIYIYSPEAIPTSIRSTIMGLLYFSSRIGAMIVPGLLRFINHPPIFFGMLALVSAYLSTFLEETLGADLPDELIEFTEPATQSFFSGSKKRIGSRRENLRRTIVSDNYFKDNFDKVSKCNKSSESLINL
jgi:MFS family permease